MSMLRALSDRLEVLAVDPETRVVVLAASGRVFCAGHDLREIREQFGHQEQQKALFDQCSKVMQQVVNLPKPVIARVAGVATAAGCQLVASCNLAVAADTARFATPGVNIGLFCSTPMVALSRNVHRKQAMPGKVSERFWISASLNGRTTEKFCNWPAMSQGLQIDSLVESW